MFTEKEIALSPSDKHSVTLQSMHNCNYNFGNLHDPGRRNALYCKWNTQYDTFPSGYGWDVGTIETMSYDIVWALQYCFL